MSDLSRPSHGLRWQR